MLNKRCEHHQTPFYLLCTDKNTLLHWTLRFLRAPTCIKETWQVFFFHHHNRISVALGGRQILPLPTVMRHEEAQSVIMTEGRILLSLRLHWGESLIKYADTPEMVYWKNRKNIIIWTQQLGLRSLRSTCTPAQGGHSVSLAFVLPALLVWSWLLLVVNAERVQNLCWLFAFYFFVCYIFGTRPLEQP